MGLVTAIVECIWDVMMASINEAAVNSFCWLLSSSSGFETGRLCVGADCPIVGEG